MANEQPDLQLRYAWDWFSYHARQRLTAFNFFLIVMGAVVVGYAQAVTNGLPAIAATLGLTGAFVALAFWAMDVRNEELVNCGRVALDEVERELKLSIRFDDEHRIRLDAAMPGRVGKRLHQGLNPRWFTHRRWLRTVITFMGVLSMVAGISAAAGFVGNSQAHQIVVLVNDQDRSHARSFAPPRMALRACDKTRRRHSSTHQPQWRWPSTGTRTSSRWRASCGHS